jgi:hypothetical protein
MLGWFKTGMQAAVKAVSGTSKGPLPPVNEPKVKAGQQSIPSIFTTAKPAADSALPRTDSRIINTDIETYRSGRDTRQVVRDFVAASPDLSAALNAYVRTAITPGYMVVAKNMDGTFSRDGTSLAQQLMARFDVVQDYSDGYSGVSSMRSCSESLAKELMLYGAMSLELVLGKDRLPRTFQPVSTTQIEFYPDKSGKWTRPVQKLGGEEIDLDIPTFFYIALDQSLLTPYATSPFEPALQPALWAQSFMNDLRRVVKRAVHPRMGVKIEWEKFKKTIPQEVLNDETKLAAYMAAAVDEISTRINSMRPEDVLVYFDTLGVEFMSNGNISLSDEWKCLQEIMDAKMSTGTKVLPSILGHGSGSQDIASSETLMFMKNAEGAVQAKLNEIYSRALTLAVRLFGVDVYVEFKYNSIDLRPEGELEAFRTMKQSRILEQLSLGFITDDEASMALTGQLTPAGFTPLSGTQFFNPPKADPAGNDNPHSNTGAAGKQKQTKAAPSQPKGPQKKGNVINLQ